MTVSQISVFANSRPGHMNRVLDLFEGAGVSVRGFSAADTGEYGILRFIVDRPEAAMEALKDAGCACVVSPVICLKLVDTPGELSRVMGVLAKCGINVVYSYSMISTYIVLSTSEPERAPGASGRRARWSSFPKRTSRASSPSAPRRRRKGA